MEQQKIYNIKSSLSFVDELAKIFLNEYRDKQAELADITFLLPNRRACQNLTDAFVRECNKMPVILPKILPVADVDEDEILLTGNAEIWQNTQPENIIKSSLCFGEKFVIINGYGSKRRLVLCEFIADSSGGICRTLE